METFKKLLSIILDVFFICLFVSAILGMTLAKLS